MHLNSNTLRCKVKTNKRPSGNLPDERTLKILSHAQKKTQPRRTASFEINDMSAFLVAGVGFEPTTFSYEPDISITIHKVPSLYWQAIYSNSCLMLSYHFRHIVNGHSDRANTKILKQIRAVCNKTQKSNILLSFGRLNHQFRTNQIIKFCSRH